jgi:hypothetical protein
MRNNSKQLTKSGEDNMRHSIYSILNANKLVVWRTWNLLAIFLILSTMMPAQSTPAIPATAQQHSSAAVQSPITPPEGKPRPIFSRPEPKLVTRPEQKILATQEAASRDTQAPPAEAAPTFAPPTPLPTQTSPDETLPPGSIIFVPTPAAGSPSDELPAEKQQSLQAPSLDSQQTQLMTTGQSILVAGGSHIQSAPTVAYNTTRNEFLVVWLDANTSPASLRGRRLSSDGTPLAEEFLIANLSSQTFNRPKVIYASTADSYLLIWGESAGTTSTEHYSYWVCNPNSCPGWVEWDTTLP